MPQDKLPLSDSTVPQFFVSGREVNELARDVQSLALEEDGGGMKRLQMELTAVGEKDGARDEQLLYMDGAIVDFGSELKLSLGPRSAPQTVFEGKVSALELAMEQGREPHLRLFAEDKLMDLRLTRRFKTYENVSDADLVQQIASQHGLSAAADAAGPTYAAVQQWNQSDLAFLRARARRLQADLWLEGSTVHLATRDARNGNRITLIQGNDLLAVEIRADLAHQRTSVVGGGYDAAAKDAIDEEAEASVAAGEAGGLRQGADLLRSAFGDRAAYRSFDVPLAGAEARAWARADMLARARRFVQVRGTTLGTPSMTVGSVVKLERVGSLFEGDDYYVTRVCHSFDLELGYRTRFEAERAGIGRPS